MPTTIAAVALIDAVTTATRVDSSEASAGYCTAELTPAVATIVAVSSACATTRTR